MLRVAFYPLGANQKEEVEILSGIGASSEEPMKNLPEFIVRIGREERILKEVSVYPRKLHELSQLSGLFAMDLVEGDGVILDHMNKRISFY